MRSCLVLLTILFLGLPTLADETGRGNGSTHGATKPKAKTRPTLTSKDIKVQTLKSLINDYEIRVKELELESFKSSRNTPGSRGEKAINKDLAAVQSKLQVTQVELALTEKLLSGECTARLFVVKHSYPVKDSDSGYVTGYREANYLVCRSLADTCPQNSHPVGLVSTFGEDRHEEYIRSEKDSREGNDCYCRCKSDRE